MKRHRPFSNIAKGLMVLLALTAGIRASALTSGCFIGNCGSAGAVGGHTSVTQSFTATCTGPMTQITFGAASAQSYIMTAKLRTVCGGGTVLATGTTSGNVGMGTNLITFASSVTLTANTVYYLEFTGSLGNVNGLEFTSDAYPGGDAQFSGCSGYGNSYDAVFSISDGSNPASPSITGFSASTVCANSQVVITGSNFTGATAVSVGGTPVSSFTVNSST